MRQRRLMTIAAAVLVAALTLAPLAARAFNPQPEPPAFGMVGVGLGQTAVLNAVLTTEATPPPDPDTPTPDDGRPECRLVLAFVGADGRSLVDNSGALVKKTVALRGGAAEVLAIRASDVQGNRQLRLPLRAVVIGPPDDSAPSDCRGLVATMEVVSPLGWTQVLYAPAIPPPDPDQPPPDDGSGR